MASIATLDPTSILGHKFEHAWLPAASLRRPSYQRVLKVPFARKIAREFDPDKLHPLIVSRRAREFAPGEPAGDYVIDGWHRLYAILEILGWRDQNVPCIIYRGLTLQQEVKYFNAQVAGSRRAVSKLDELHADYEAGVGYALSIVSIVEANGLAMDWEMTGRLGTIRAGNACVAIWRVQGPSIFSLTLRILRDSWGRDKRAYNNEWLYGMASFLLRYRRHALFSQSEIARKLQAVGIDAVIAQAGRITALTGSMNARSNYGRAILVSYNDGRRSRRLPEWDVMERQLADEMREVDRQRRSEATARGKALPTSVGSSGWERQVARLHRSEELSRLSLEEAVALPDVREWIDDDGDVAAYPED